VATKHTDKASPGGELSHRERGESGKKWKHTPSTISKIAGTHVQRGTKRPSGNTKKRTGKMLPKKVTKASDHYKAE
jgi:hypothetical protein